jgi:serine/threonine-protein kinase HipA
VGALQFVPEGEEIARSAKITGEVISDEEIEKLLNNLAKAPLGLDRDEEFRISVAGAQEKTSLFRHNGKWLKPHDTTPTTHILKTQIGSLPEGVDLSNSVENEYYCLKLMAAFGLPVNEAEITVFGSTKALVIKRFDRTWTNDKQLLRLPQEDLCQALSFPPTRKYQSDGGPGMVEILNLLKASDTPFEDSKIFLKTQILFWLMGATDGHAKNFSIFLGERGAFHLTPIDDVLTTQPSVDNRELERKRMKLAMFVGNSRHYKIDEIMGRHFIQTAERAGLPGSIAKEALAEIANAAPQAMGKVEKQLPAEFPQEIHDSVKQGLEDRLQRI